MTLKCQHRFALSALSGVLLLLSFPSFDLWPLIWIGLIPLLVAIDGTRPRRALFLGWVCGAIYVSGMTYWILPLYPYANLPIVLLATLLLTGYLSFYVAGFSWTVRWLDLKSPPAYIFIPAALWTTLELIRGWLFTGLPWGSLGHSQYGFLPIAQIASMTGLGGISFLVVTVNMGLARLILNFGRWRKELRYIAVPFALFVICLGYGIWKLKRPLQPAGKIEIALIPGNVEQREKMYGDPRVTFRRYLERLDDVIYEKPDLIVFPETHVLMDLLRPNRSVYIQMLQNRLKGSGSWLLFGIPHYETGKDGGDYNTAVLLSPERVVGKYYKQHLVPFSEYTPLRRYLPKFIKERLVGVADFDKGRESVIFTLPGGIRFGVVICFESVFPYIFREFVREGVDFMGIITNDAWFEGTSAPYQHYAMAPFRAIEMRKAVFRCANKGVTCVIGPKGDVISGVIRPDENGVIIAEVPLYPGTTFYMRYGEWLPLASLVAVLASIAFFRGKTLWKLTFRR
jgi:apolipoprotein N-acyltransferase